MWFKHLISKCYFIPIKMVLKCHWCCASPAEALPLVWFSLVPGEQSYICCGSIIFKKAKFKPLESSPWYAEGCQNNINSK